MAVGGWAVGIGIGSLCVDQLSRGIGGFVLTEEQQVWTGELDLPFARVWCHY